MTAQLLNDRTAIKWNSVGWDVLASDTNISARSEENYKFYTLYYESSAEEYQSEINEEYQNEVSKEISEEMQSEQDDWGRNEEEGWFYED